MANMMEYINWRGDITFEQSPLNKVDGLVFSQLVYLELEKIITFEEDTQISIAEIGERYFSVYSENEIDQMTNLIKKCSALLKEMMEVERYKDLLISNYRVKYDPLISEQFGAMVIKCKPESIFVAFRGTDDTLSGWEEDFKLSYMSPVASQIEAETYLKKVLEKTQGDVYIGGHSKGGNLSIYSAIKQEAELQDRIKKIYNYDGPGFMKDVVELPGYQSISHKIFSFMPQESIVGMILYREEDYRIIQSDEKGLMQHTASSWVVSKNDFIYLENMKHKSRMFNHINHAWVEEISYEQRELFIKIIFEILRSGEYDTVTGLASDVPKAMNTIIKTYKELDKTTKKRVKDVIGQILFLSTKSITENRKK